MSNQLAQHGQLSLLTVGAGLHIQSLPEGAQVSIRALAERFPDSEYRIGRALGELEAAGFLSRTRLRTADGRVVTRTVSYNVPRAETPPGLELDPEPEPDPEPVPPAPVPPAPGPEPVVGPPGDRDGVREPVPEPVRQSQPAPGARREAAKLLAGLRIREPRLLLAERDVERLVPGVVEWLERGAAPEAVRRALTADVPSDLRNPAGLVAYRLRSCVPAPLPPLPPHTGAPGGPPPPDSPRYPFQTCDGCERAFRAPAPGRCRDCAVDPPKAKAA
ncbi:helix-turn-helix domain-containing protein [Streptomyces sp. NBC_01006]|uniref:helix-turn-helix domain-containing protein n=1 Tax=Streptomyces sp. NBC_01006 TaxID=2903716 RepID=UPI0038641EE1|nr:helix-turn-helix domain-containing protein [Streptomyces sp. NBC_01006]